jgi:pimeloyl-ACP methyl ester carboxylesterase
MPTVNVNDQTCVYDIEGDGFPLLLVSDPYDAISLWRPLMPLLGEVCKAVTYAYNPVRSSGRASERLRSDRLADDFLTLLDILAIERVYLAATAPAVPMITKVMQQASTRLEGLILIGKAEDDTLTSSPVWQTSTIPMLLVIGEQDPDHCQWAARQVAHLPHVKQCLVPGAGKMPLREQMYPLGHMMMQFLLHCERQRNLVRGASFLL